MSDREVTSRFATMFALVVAGELIFSLPFHVARYFRPTVLQGLALSNAELGDVFAVYGVTAMLSYFPGGAIADRWNARSLMSASLLATAAGGLYLASLPGVTGLAWLYGYWGVTTILLFWAPMIRATRRWGGATQGRAFGVLDGGRGLAAAAFATAAVWLFSGFAQTSTDELLNAERRAGLRAVVLFYSFATAAAAAMIWQLVPDDDDQRPGTGPTDVAGLRIILSRRGTWLQALVVACAYCGYKGLDNYALYAVDVLGLSEIDAARFATVGAYTRPVAAVFAGMIADRFRATTVIGLLFSVLVLAYLGLGTTGPGSAPVSLLYANIFVTFLAVFGLRGIYFALLEETGVPYQSTGAAVGLISLVGFTPDIFFAPIAGRLLDATPGLGGHHHYFLLLAAVATIGAVATVLLSKSRFVASKQEASE